MAAKTPSRTDPVRQLIDEHEIFMEALADLRRIMASLPDDIDTVPVYELSRIEEVWRAINEHLNVHFVKEEVVFFPMIERMISGARVKFQFLHVDHDRLRENFEEFTTILQDYRAQGGTPKRIGTLRHLGNEMVRWFYYHIVAEDSIYFEIAEEQLDADEVNAALKRMAQIEAELRESLPDVDPKPVEQRRRERDGHP